MPKMKWDISGKGVPPSKAGGLGYDGPELPKGSWPAKVKRMEVIRIASNTVNKGKPRIRLLMEVQTANLKGKEEYHGAPVWDGLNIIEQSQGFVNAFLHALTDGSERAKRAIEAVFWDEDKGPDYKRVENKRGDKETHITKIGRVPINSPNGEVMIQIVTRAGQDQNGNYRPEIAGYLPYLGEKPKAVEPQDDDEDDDLIGDEEDDEEDYEEDEDYEDEEDEGDDDEDISDEQDAKETAKSGSRKRPPF